jgi:uncharacterized protein YutE (UPF0331/DUF86 family)
MLHIAIEQALKPNDYYEAILRMGELGILPPEFALRLAPIAGFRNILIHEYLTVDWSIVYSSLQDLDDLEQFSSLIQQWLARRLP